MPPTRRTPRGVVPVEPQPGQESVWDYPRPPRTEPSAEHVVVRLGGAVVVDTRRSLRLLETSHPPTYYLPLDDVAPGAVRPAAGSSFCEWKGVASYLDVVGGSPGQPVVAERAAWTYPRPTPPFEHLAGYLALYPALMDECTVDDEPVRPQDGGFYGGWVTGRVVGPFKGGAGSSSW